MKRVNIMYFSPTDTTKKVLLEIGNRLLEKEEILRGDIIDFTKLKIRQYPVSFSKDDILLIGVPVYAGRVPNILLKYLNSIKGEGSVAVPVVLYGNREYDDALIELNNILIANGFNVIAAASFIGEHSFSFSLAKDRPDKEDLIIAKDLGDSIYNKLMHNNYDEINIKGNRPYRNYYVPKDENEGPIDIRKVTPKTDDNCIDCKTCAELCPMGSIDYDNVKILNGICIKCGACIKKCPTGSKHFDDLDYLRHKEELEDQFKERKSPDIFI